MRQPNADKPPDELPFHGTKEFRETSLKMYFRKSLLEQHTYDQVAIVIAHELSHVVLDSIRHPLRREEKAVDLTAMLLGFRRMYVSGAHRETRLGNGVRTQTFGYLSIEEVRHADHILGMSDAPSRFVQELANRLEGTIGASILKKIKARFFRGQA
jgi:hypothetical protein